MSHFSVLCIVGTNVTEEGLDERLATMLDPYDENMEVTPYKDRIDAEHRGRDLGSAIPEAVLKRCGPRPTFDIEGMRKQFATMTEGTVEYAKLDERWKAGFAAQEAYDAKVGEAFTAVEYADAINKRWKNEPGNREYVEVDDEGPYTMSTYNPDSKWDWYSIGGRWGGLLPLKPGAVGAIGRPPAFGGPNDEQVDGKHADIAQAGDVVLDGLENLVFAMLTPEGWEQPAKMGWWGITHSRTESEDEWRDRVKKSLEALDPRTWLVVVDCHI